MVEESWIDKNGRKSSLTKIDLSPKRRRGSYQSNASRNGTLSSNKSLIVPEEIFKKYRDFKAPSLKVSEYKETSLRIINTISMVKDVKQFNPIPPEQQIDFKFKKKGFDKLLLFDLDETLIHS